MESGGSARASNPQALPETWHTSAPTHCGARDGVPYDHSAGAKTTNAVADVVAEIAVDIAAAEIAAEELTYSCSGEAVEGGMGRLPPFVHASSMSCTRAARGAQAIFCVELLSLVHASAQAPFLVHNLSRQWWANLAWTSPAWPAAVVS